MASYGIFRFPLLWQHTITLQMASPAIASQMGQISALSTATSKRKKEEFAAIVRALFAHFFVFSLKTNVLARGGVSAQKPIDGDNPLMARM